MSLKLELCRNKHNLCCSDFGKHLPPLSQSKSNPKKQLFDNLLRLQLFQILLERERNFKRIYFANFEKTMNEPLSHMFTKTDLIYDITLPQDKKFCAKVINKIFQNARKIQQRRLQPFTLSERVMNKIYQTKDDTDPTNTKTVHRIQLVEYQPHEILPPLIGEYVPMDKPLDDFYEKFMEK